MISRFQLGGAGRDGGLRTVLGLLLLAVLLPTAGLLYFINEAAATQRNLARQRLGEAYRGQLRLVGERIDTFWEQRARDLDGSASETPALTFEHYVRDGLADSVICLGPDGQPVYPSLAGAPRPDPTLGRPEWIAARTLESAGKPAEASLKYRAIADAGQDPAMAARAAQAAIRCLLADNRTDAALALNERFFTPVGLTYATGLDGRLIAADEHLLYLQLVGHDDPRFAVRAQILFGLLQNYAREIPSSQRLFLMDQLRALAVRPQWRTFPTYQAERGAERVLSDRRAVAEDAVLRMSGVADVWKLTSPGKRVIGLYATKTVLALTQQFLERTDARGPQFSIAMPGRPLPPHADAMPAGPRLPGWQITMSVANPGAGDAGRQIASYFWIGFLTVVAVAVLAMIGAQILRRHMRIANLKTDLVAAVSHELKTPLSSMKLLVESLLAAEQFEPGRTRQYLQMVARENSRLSRLIDNFLTFSRMERDRGRFDFSQVRPEAVAHAAVEAVGDRFPVALALDPALPVLYADEDALVTVLLNLLDNAYKYTRDDRRIHLRAFVAGGRLCFAVADNGIGIAERDQKRIFRRFYQVDRLLARQAGGVGLGLSIVEFIVKAHGGVVSVSSRPGSGSIFTVSLPPSSSNSEVAA